MSTHIELTSEDRGKIRKIEGLLKIIDKYKNPKTEAEWGKSDRIIGRTKRFIDCIDKGHFQIRANEALTSLSILRTFILAKFDHYYQVFVYLQEHQDVIRQDLPSEVASQLRTNEQAETTSGSNGTTGHHEEDPLLPIF